ncbi:MAG: hypothetical protein ACTSVI_16830, partial [Promethearchaeota archaeon]
MSRKRDASGHRTDTSKVQFWVKKHLLEKWDEFCDKHSLNRTAFLIQAANHFILDYNLSPQKEESKSDLDEKYDLIQGQIGKMMEIIKERKA